jgi:hypothetical protein
MDNGFIESFNGKFRNECLNENWFLNLQHAQELIEIWRTEGNEVRPQSSLDDKTPYEFVKEHHSMQQEKGLNLNLVHIWGEGPLGDYRIHQVAISFSFS